MKHEILLLSEVAERLRVSPATINRLLSKRRRGDDVLFPLPLSQFKGRGRWLASDIDSYIESLATVNTSVHIPVSVKSKKRQEREFIERQERAKAALKRHRIGNDAANTN